MDFLHTLSWGYVASGFLVGSLVGLTGVGGGSLMTPILILLFGVQPLVAVGTDLLYAAATKTAGTFFHGFNHTIDWRVVRRLATGSIPAALITLLALHSLGISSGAANMLVSKVLGGALLATSSALIFRRQLLAYYRKRVGPLDERRTRQFTIATGAVLGVLVTSSSVGAGALGVTALILLYPEIPIARLVGSDIAHAVPLTLVSGLGHLFFGNINIQLLGTLLIGSLPGIFFGSALASRVPDRLLRYILASVLLLVAARLLT
ncbi:MAG: sulfite exporter TauE/SafE family protein [Alphaproteobacteria bacterium]|nr:sulfite exporter TauE/SafE family protein [Alphaproteobacteria bacterium]MDE1985386.1 sulfite exporter TauE/SafE family protein [Alphaproteobacteria bacterium]MDE2161987.1 sulfite exporter TauE/SafE family protein [Alphaproteobacteria bacterium]MDE2265439.1 sulfite exporter TauE/SafE family protein [Alphaproteobacteria bacterium]MDE2499512.1 sulfite exporter TauE/SafE family protein [Alphaproteobacteria bacterium]